MEPRFLHDYEKLYHELTDRYLLFLYRKSVAPRWFGFVLVQGARYQGRFAIELGLSRRPQFPYYYGSTTPFFAVDSVRERTGVLQYNEDRWWVYKSQKELETYLQDALVYGTGRGMNKMMEVYRDRLEQETEKFLAPYLSWEGEEGEKEDVPLGRRFPRLVNERAAYEFIQQVMGSREFERILGPLRRNYLPPRSRWLSCHVYTMAWLMDKVEPGEIEMYRGPWHSNTDDQGHWLTQRASVNDYLPTANTFDERLRQYTFLKSLSAVEAHFKEPETS